MRTGIVGVLVIVFTLQLLWGQQVGCVSVAFPANMPTTANFTATNATTLHFNVAVPAGYRLRLTVEDIVHDTILYANPHHEVVFDGSDAFVSRNASCSPVEACVGHQSAQSGSTKHFLSYVHGVATVWHLGLQLANVSQRAISTLNATFEDGTLNMIEGTTYSSGVGRFAHVLRVASGRSLTVTASETSNSRTSMYVNENDVATFDNYVFSSQLAQTSSHVFTASASLLSRLYYILLNTTAGTVDLSFSTSAHAFSFNGSSLEGSVDANVFVYFNISVPPLVRKTITLSSMATLYLQRSSLPTLTSFVLADTNSTSSLHQLTTDVSPSSPTFWFVGVYGGASAASFTLSASDAASVRLQAVENATSTHQVSQGGFQYFEIAIEGKMTLHVESMAGLVDVYFTTSTSTFPTPDTHDYALSNSNTSKYFLINPDARRSIERWTVGVEGVSCGSGPCSFSIALLQGDQRPKVPTPGDEIPGDVPFDPLQFLWYLFGVLFVWAFLSTCCIGMSCCIGCLVVPKDLGKKRDPEHMKFKLLAKEEKMRQKRRRMDEIFEAAEEDGSVMAKKPVLHLIGEHGWK